ncbi:MAG: hypothetical protein CL608_32835 [Anaerolineaceae bacterium]|nr:hypothetical protein [Anaerolineaceae bacterium]
MFRRYALLGLLLTLSLTLLFALQLTMAQGAVQPRHTEFSPPRLLTASPQDTLVFQPVDIDQDGDLDVISGGSVNSELVWYENRGLVPPSFQVHLLDTGLENVQALETADLDGDGDLDLLLSTLLQTTIFWFENQGGTPPAFIKHELGDGGSRPRGLKTADLDRDGDFDVISTANLDDTVVWFENETAVFTRHIITNTLDGAYAVYPADLDQNGYVDLVVAASGADAIVWFAHDGGALPTFTPHVITDTAVGAVAVHVVDLNKDGALDIISGATGNNTVAWYESDGAALPSFTSHIVSAEAAMPWLISAADLDDDGDVDVLSGSSTGTGQMNWYESDGTLTPTFVRHEVANGLFTYSLFAEDIDQDDDLDLLTLRDAQVAWYENDGAPTPDFSFHYVVTPTFGAHGIFAADLDSDGDVDVLSGSADDGQVAWYENDGSLQPAFTAHTITTDTERPLRVIAAYINNDPYLDVVSSSRLDGKIAWYANDGNQPPVFTMYTITTGIFHPVSLDVADLDGDSDEDLISGAGDWPVGWYENSGGANPTFTAHEVYTDFTDVFAIKAVDIDGDLDIDIVGGSARENLYWFENDGTDRPTFTSHVVALNLNAQHVYAADVNGDGFMDILSTSGPYWNNSTVAWYENDGALPPSFTPHTITTDTVTTKFVYAADIDKDGDTDVFSASQGDDKVVWYENDGADPPNFITHILSDKAGGARSLFSADLNGDGFEELLFASFDDGKIGWHQNIPPLYKLFLPIVHK